MLYRAVTGDIELDNPQPQILLASQFLQIRGVRPVATGHVSHRGKDRVSSPRKCDAREPPESRARAGYKNDAVLSHEFLHSFLSPLTILQIRLSDMARNVWEVFVEPAIYGVNSWRDCPSRSQTHCR